jgi:quinol monooxygenase YgiN
VIYVIASIQAEEGKRDELAQAFRGVLDKVRAKPGCIEYSLALHTPSGFAGQAPYEDNVLLIVEKWRDMGALQAHISDPVYQSWFAVQWELIADASMQIMGSI